MARRRSSPARQGARSRLVASEQDPGGGVASIQGRSAGRNRQARGADRLMNVQEVAEFLGVPVGYVYRHAGVLGGVKVGKYLRFPMAELLAYLERNRLMPRRRGSGAL